MKKQDIERELIKLAKIRWEILRKDTDYQGDFEIFINENPEQKNNPMIFEDFEDDNYENIVASQVRVGMYLGIIYGEEWHKYAFPDSGYNFNKKWCISPPVYKEVDNPNPLSFYSLMDKPVSVLGRYSFNLMEITSQMNSAEYDAFQNLGFL